MAAIKALVPWFGAAREQAGRIAAHLDGAAWLGVPFAGGMCELAEVKARAIVVNDLHRHVVNLARVVADPEMHAELVRRLESLPFHPDVLADAQRECLELFEWNGFSEEPSLRSAVAYFVTQWMGRSGKAGTEDEFRGGLSVRWTSSGGSSIRRYRSAVESLDEWHEILRRCEFATLDFADFLSRVVDHEGHVVYADPPWPELGDGYRHGFAPEQHADLARRLTAWTKTKAVVRINDHPLVRSLYREADGWRWIPAPWSRNQANREVREVLLVREP